MSALPALEWLLAYLLGALSGALLLGRLRGVDIRTQGSGNAGATNALRTQGWGFALGVAGFDIAKGVIAVLLIAGLLAPADLTQRFACGLAAAIGHCYPIWHGFRGGKGAATLFAVMLTLFPWIGGLLFLLWLTVLVLTGYVGLATVLAGISFPLLLLTTSPTPALLALGVAAGLLIVWMHRVNLARLKAGTEHRFERVRIFHRRKTAHD
ncbi:MAG: glycerol-3-phosphate 1-O-acyltransferase PlsY [Xanthomonadales bacterium]|nr:glycerol-3-phosphate 1-O-acyltransferase PlsY [Xanthomonadales bacterium]